MVHLGPGGFGGGPVILQHLNEASQRTQPEFLHELADLSLPQNLLGVDPVSDQRLEVALFLERFGAVVVEDLHQLVNLVSVQVQL